MGKEEVTGERGEVTIGGTFHMVMLCYVSKKHLLYPL